MMAVSGSAAAPDMPALRASAVFSPCKGLLELAAGKEARI